LTLTSLTSGGRSVGIVRSRTKATEFSVVFKSKLLCFVVLSSVFVCPLANLNTSDDKGENGTTTVIVAVVVAVVIVIMVMDIYIRSLRDCNIGMVLLMVENMN
jgi:uncharacterized membrane protein YhaH (DUF805 family)